MTAVPHIQRARAAEDRRHGGVLAVTLLAWGLCVAPALHAAAHAARALPRSRASASGAQHSHSHGPSVPNQPHGAGSLEHLSLAALPSAINTVVSVITWLVEAQDALRPRYVRIDAERPRAMPQGP